MRMSILKSDFLCAFKQFGDNNSKVVHVKGMVKEECMTSSDVNCELSSLRHTRSLRPA